MEVPHAFSRQGHLNIRAKIHEQHAIVRWVIAHQVRRLHECLYAKRADIFDDGTRPEGRLDEMVGRSAGLELGSDVQWTQQWVQLVQYDFNNTHILA